MTGCECVCSGKGCYVVETRRAEKGIRNAGDNVAMCQERASTVCDDGLQTVQGSCKGCVSKSSARN
jgi:hypothetical protein